MVKCTFLLPNRDNEGRCLQATHTRIFDLLYERYGGYTIDSTSVRGTYRMKGGEKAWDVLTRVVVVVEESQVKELRKWVSQFACELRQESIYFERSLAKVEFIFPEEHPLKSLLKTETATDRVLVSQEDKVVTTPMADDACKDFIQTVKDQHQAALLTAKVNVLGVAEVGGELPCGVVQFLKNWGYQVLLYPHHGVTATVIRK